MNRLYTATKGYKTITGAIITFLAVITGVISADEASQLTELIIGVIGFALTIYGRIDANRPIE